MYSLVVHKRALDASRSFPAADLERIIEAVWALASEARPFGSKKLRGYIARYRVRCGSYRIVYEINDDDKIVKVLVVGHRKDVYRSL